MRGGITNYGLIRTTAVFALFSMLVLGLAFAFYVSPAVAQEGGEGSEQGESSIDMDKDGDGDGIPDEFETEFRKLLDKVVIMDSGSLKMGDIYKGEAHQALHGFYHRLPISVATKDVLDELPGLYQEMILDDDSEKDSEALSKIVAKERQLIEDDKVYADAVRYIGAVLAEVTGGGEATPQEYGNGFDGLDLQRQEPNPDFYERRINQVGDVIFRDTRSDRSVKATYRHEYAMRWMHSGVYAGNGRAYDADADEGEGCAGNGSGVALRLLNRYYRNGYGIQHSQMKNASARASEADALDAAMDTFGVACRTPFAIKSSKTSTDSFYCSKLVWRIYEDNEDYPTDVDSNHFTYFDWLYKKYGWVTAAYILLYWVAPDEIALDGDLDHYYRQYFP